MRRDGLGLGVERRNSPRARPPTPPRHWHLRYACDEEGVHHVTVQSPLSHEDCFGRVEVHAATSREGA